MTFSELQENFAIKNGYVGWHEIEDDHKLELVCNDFAKFCLEAKEEELENLGQLVDKIDNLHGSLQLPMPPQFHVEQMKTQLKDVSEELKNIYLQLGGEPVWD